MAIDFTGLATGLGKIVGGLNELNAFRGTDVTARIASIRATLTVDPDLGDGLTEDGASLLGNCDSWVQALSTQAQDLIVAEVKDDVNLADLGVGSCLQELVRQMTVAGESFKTARCTASVTQITGSGTVTVYTSLYDSQTGALSDYALPDEILITAVTPTYFTLLGLAAENLTDPGWPGGAGVNTTVLLTDPDVGSGDPGFETWTSATVLTYWTTVAGTPDRIAGDPYGGTDGSYVCGINSTDHIQQSFPTTAKQAYLLTAWVKKTATSANTGAVTLSLKNAAGTLIGTALAVPMSGLTSSWVLYTGVTVASVDATGSTLNAVSTLGAGDVSNVSGVQAIPLYPLYSRGISVVLLRGITAPLVNDTWRITVTETASLPPSLLRGLDRLINLSAYPVSIPTSGSPTQADALVS